MNECTYYCFQGAGLKIVAYLGLVEAWAKHFPSRYGVEWNEHVRTNVRGACGASAGAGVALAVCLNLPVGAMRRILEPVMSNAKVILPYMDIAELWQNYGFERGGALRDMIHALLREGGLSPTIDFRSLHRLTAKEFACTGTNLSTQKSVVFSLQTTPDMLVADALFISMCVPIMFAPVKYNGEYYVDGALSCNTPSVFPIECTLVCGVDGTRHVSITKWQEFIGAILSIGLAAQEAHEALLSKECKTYVCIFQTPVLTHLEPMDLNMDASIKTQLFMCGYATGTLVLYPFLRDGLRLLLAVVTRLRELVVAQDGGFEADPGR